MAKITTHVLDISRGKPAAGVAVALDAIDAGGNARRIASGATDDDGRARALTDPDGVGAGTYRLTFDVGAHYEKSGTETFYPHAQITFVVKEPSAHFHVPLLLSPFGFSTYRGS
jgi:5-hydroxyisourate hydrolase